jgi:hypothetical protein
MKNIFVVLGPPDTADPDTAAAPPPGIEIFWAVLSVKFKVYDVCATGSMIKTR